MRNLKFRNILGVVAAVVLGAAPMVANAQTKTNVLELLRFAEEAKARATYQKQEAIAKAMQRGIPIRREDRRRRQLQELMAFVGDMPVYYKTLNAEAARTLNTDRVYPGGDLGTAFTGMGLLIGEWDGGSARVTHNEFTGRVLAVDGAEEHYHATHVGGTIMAAGKDPAARGMAFDANLNSYDWNADESEMAVEAANGLRISNHSYGSWDDYNPWTFGSYAWSSVGFDTIAYNAPFYLICQAAGNSQGTPLMNGWNTVIIPGTAKNVLTVGAVRKIAGTYTGPESVRMSDFSSWGPTDDGRLKPEVVSPGVDLYSTFSGADDAYYVLSGTSMATPAATGSLALVGQAYEQTHDGALPRSATVKALAIHTADEAGPALGPDYQFGFGLLNTASAVSLVLDDVDFPDLIQETGVGGEFPDSYEYEVNSDGMSDLKVTIVWTDPPGTSNEPGVADDPTPKLINDLDLRVENNGVVYKPWVLNPNRPGDDATTGDNTLDNVEQVVFRPEAGPCKITVNFKNTLTNGSQAFTLIVTGAKTAELVSFDVNPKMIVGGKSLTGTLELSSRAPSGGAWITLESSNKKVIPVSKVNVKSGLKTMDFAIRTRNVTKPTNVTLTATYGNQSFSQVVEVNPPGLRSFYFDPDSVNSGATAKAFVSLGEPAPVGGAVVTIASSDRSLVTHDWKIVIPEGEATASFDVQTGSVSGIRTITFWAAYPGPTQKAYLTIGPSVDVSAVSVNPAKVLGGVAATGKVSLSNPARTGGKEVLLSSSDTSLATVPDSVTVNEGSSSANFTVNTVVVTETKNVTITAQTGNVTVTTVITLQPEGVQSLDIPEMLVKGTTGTGTVTLTGAAAQGGVVVNLSSSNTSVASVPTSVTVAAGKTSATFMVTAKNVATTSTATITATVGNTSDSDTVKVTAESAWLTLDRATVTNGVTATATLHLANAPTSNLRVGLKSNSKVARVPFSITVRPGQTAVSFPVRVSGVKYAGQVTITATVSGKPVTLTFNVAP